MASPLPTITVTGKFVDLTNRPANGSVILTPMCRVAGMNWLVSGRPVRAYVRDGLVSASIIGNSDLLSGDLYVRVDERIDGDPTHRAYIIRPEGDTVDLSVAPQLCITGPGTDCCTGDMFVPASAVGQPGGVATLGSDGLLAVSQRPPGSGGGSAFEYVQSTPLSVITVSHGLGFRPQVSMYSLDWAVQYDEYSVQHLTTNQIRVTMDQPTPCVLVMS